MEDAVPSPISIEREIESTELGEILNSWLKSLPHDHRVLFVRRYWYGISLSDLANECGISPKKLAQKMYRLRLALKVFLAKEGIFHAEDR